MIDQKDGYKESCFRGSIGYIGSIRCEVGEMDDALYNGPVLFIKLCEGVITQCR